MTWGELYVELKGWQTVIGSVLGFLALTWGALYNYHLGRNRDDRIREREGHAVALALYSEIVHLRRDLAVLANGVGRWYAAGGYNSLELPAHFLTSFRVPEPSVFEALKSKIGLLTADRLSQITAFYVELANAKQYIPELVGGESKMVSYGAEWVIEPAIKAITSVERFIAEIELTEGLPRTAAPGLGKAQEALDLANELKPDF